VGQTGVDIYQTGSHFSRLASADYFTGTVWIDSIVEAPSPARARAILVRFEPGARTFWHSHPLGQTLWVLSGKGLVQGLGGPRHEIGPGDVVWIPPKERHWHGAGPATPMAHIAIYESLDGKAVDWAERVTDDQYET
jgi:quercetin dioxygenase-like cupin family protein